MKKMKKLIAVLILLSGFDSVCASDCSEQIKIFYKAYLTNILEDSSRNTDLCKTWFTPALIEKVGRMGNATGADPVIRAQDANEDAIETLRVSKLTDGWYLVGYLWKQGDDATLMEIPVQAQEADGRCRITYITPEWNGTRYGDELVCRGESRSEAVDQSDAISFLKSFYDRYLARYCAMSADLAAELASLRARHLSAAAAEQFRRAEAENEADGLRGYDLLIDNFDFDCLWRGQIDFTHLKGSDYRVTYRGNDRTCTIVVRIKRADGGYMIDGIGSTSSSRTKTRMPQEQETN